jgi:PAS domain S-box-containing protein
MTGVSVSEAQFRTLADSIPQLAWMADTTGHIFWYNQRWYEYTGSTEAEMEGWGWQSVHDPEILPDVMRRWRSAIDSGTPFEMEFPLRGANGSFRWFLTRVTPVLDANGKVVRWFGTNTDVDELREARQSAMLAGQRLAFLARASAALATTLDVNATLETLARMAVPEIADWVFVEMLNEEGIPRPVVIHHADEELVATGWESMRRHPIREQNRFGSMEVARTGEPALVPEISDEIFVQVAHDDEHLRMLRAMRFRSSVQVPLKVRESVVGVVTFVTAHSDRRYGQADLELAEEIATRVSVALHNAQLYEAERAAHGQAERERQKLEAVLAVVPIGIGIASDRDCVDIRVNPAFAEHLGIDNGINASKSSSTGEHLPFVVRKNGVEVPPDQLPMQRAAREGVTIRDEEYEIARGDGRVIRLLEYAAPLYDEDGSIRGSVGAFVDVTERAELLARERDARAEAEAASRAKSEFLATMSHELRTPLNAIGGYAELIELGIHGPVSPEQRQALDRIQTSQRHLLGLINGVLNYARVEAGAVHYDMRALSVEEVLATCESLTSPQVRARKISYRRAPCAPELEVRADREKLQQVLLNILSNSIKFTEPGGSITVRVEARDDRVGIHVEDTGRGIPADRLEAVFEPFVQVDARLTRTEEGVGLGLAISRDLARGMGGDLTVKSELGVGSVFSLWLGGYQNGPPDR